MTKNLIDHVAQSLVLLQETIHRRFRSFFQKNGQEEFTYPEIKLENNQSPVSEFLVNHQVNVEEYIILFLALAPNLQPNFLDVIVQQYLSNGGEFPEIGGVKGNNHRGTIPTGETALFILAGNDISNRLRVLHYFSPDHFFSKENVLQLELVKEGEPRMSGKIFLEQEYIDLFTTGTIGKPSFGPGFPAKLVTTKMEWKDLILNSKTASSIDDIKIWLQHNATFINEWGIEKKIKPGFRALFHGRPGCGKTLTATLLGKQFQKDVYRIDLSQVVSKYVGETEKNLENVFTRAENKDWILFFDEADALFSKRSNVQSANDKFANQEASYLLQRVEDFPGLIVLASNFKNNIDEGFIRRFNSIIHFPMPSARERHEIWKTSIPPKASLEQEIYLQSLAAKYELSGSAIVNVIHYASLRTIDKRSFTISKQDILEGIRREYEKEEKVFIGND